MKFLIFTIFLLFLPFMQVSAQDTEFDALADEVNRISIYKKTKSLEMLDNLYKMAYKSTDTSLLIARCLYEEALLNYRQGIEDTALKQKIIKRIEKVNIQSQEQALLLFALGTESYIAGNYSEAYTLYLQALDIFKHLKNNRFIAKTQNYLGNICFDIGLYNLSDNYYYEAILNVTPELHEYYIIKQNIIVNELHNNNETAIDSMFYLLEVAEKSGNEEVFPLIYSNIAYWYNDEIRFFYLTKLETLDFDNPSLKASNYINMGVYYMDIDLNKALYYNRKASKIFEEVKDLSGLLIAYGNISHTFEQQNIPDSALFYLKKHTELVHEISSNTIAIEIHQKYITSLVEAQKNELIIAEQNNELKNRQIVIIAIVSGSAVLIILLLLLFIRQRLTVKIKMQKLEKEKNEELLDAKIREITSYTMLVANKNQILKQISEQIEQAIKNKVNIDKTLTEIVKIIQGSLNIDEEWNNFKLHFEKVHPHFFKKLKNQFPNLTEENLKLCAYIKIGMTTKQIAQLLHISSDSMNVFRYRIRKKLKLHKEDDLNDFLRNI